MVRRFQAVACGLAILASCGGPSREPLPGTVRRTLDVGGETREYLLRVPASYTGGEAVPLVVVLHARGSHAAFAEEIYGFSRLAEQHGFIVAYPEASGGMRSWQPRYRKQVNADENIEFVRGLLDAVAGEYRIDSRRVYACGHSSGAILAHGLAAELSDRFAAVGVVAGSIGFTFPRRVTVPVPTARVSVIVFHARDDETIPFDQERGAAMRHNSFVSAPDSVEFWVRHNGCLAEPEREELHEGNCVRLAYSTSDGGTDVVFYDVVHGGHNWPTGENDTPDATALIWEFFAAHPKG